MFGNRALGKLAFTRSILRVDRRKIHHRDTETTEDSE